MQKHIMLAKDKLQEVAFLKDKLIALVEISYNPIC